MSFSTKVKTELSRFKSRDTLAELAELSAIIRVNSTLKLAGLGKIDLIISTENKDVGEMISKLFRKRYSISPDIEIDRSNNLRQKEVHRIIVKDAMEILKELEVIKKNGGIFDVNDQLPVDIIKNPACKNAYIRGCFLGCGSITNPGKSYYIQYIIHSEEYAHNLNDLFHAIGINSKVISRKKNYIIYLKDGDSISELLGMMGATKSMMDFEELRLEKQLNGNVNRKYHCDLNNAVRINDTYLKQKKFLEIIDRTIGLDSLPKNLKDIAYLRLENEVDSLKELGEKLDPPLSKSGVNYRLKQIEKLALQLKEDEE